MTKPADPTTTRGYRTKARLLAAAEEELLEHGCIEVARVADRAGASLGLLYRYFDGKDGLVTAVVDRFYDRYEEAVFAVAAPAGSRWLEHEWQRIEREVLFLFDEPLARRLVGGSPAEPAAAYADARRLARHIAMAVRNIEHGQRRGEIASAVDPALAAAAIIGGLRACLGVALAEGSGTQPTEVVETVMQISAAVITPVEPA